MPRWDGVVVKNVTVTLDDETYRRARIRAAELDTSVSALVRRYLQGLAGGESEFERLEKLERTLRGRIKSFRAGGRLTATRFTSAGLERSMVARLFIDTSVLLYSSSRHPGEVAKRDRAVALLAADDLALSAQALQDLSFRAGHDTHTQQFSVRRSRGVTTPT